MAVNIAKRTLFVDKNRFVREKEKILVQYRVRTHKLEPTCFFHCPAMVVIAEYKRDLTVELVENLPCILRRLKCNIAEQENMIPLFYDTVPVFNERSIHLIRRSEWAIHVLDNLKMPKMRVGKKKCLLLRIGIHFAGFWSFFRTGRFPLTVDFECRFSKAKMGKWEE